MVDWKPLREVTIVSGVVIHIQQYNIRVSNRASSEVSVKKLAQADISADVVGEVNEKTSNTEG